MDDALVLIMACVLLSPLNVLILVVMDDALVQYSHDFDDWEQFVLILVVMDDALVHRIANLMGDIDTS